MSWSRISNRQLLVISGIWLLVLVLFPCLHGQKTAFIATAGIIAANGVFVFRILTNKRKVLVTLNLVQIVLFGFLNYQLYCAFGEDHYEVDHDPGLGDWVKFTLAHVCRAADVLDAIDQYGFELQAIRHDSVSSGIILVCMHLGADVFLIGLLLRWLGSFWKNPGESILVRGRRNVRWFLLAVGLFFGFAAGNGFAGWDWVLWPLDNFLHFLDIGDMMEIFGWSLYDDQGGFWNSTFTLAFRFTFGGWAADLLLWLHFSWLGGWGIDREELVELLREGDVYARQGAARSLGTCGPRAVKAVPVLIEALADPDITVRCQAARTLGKIGPRARRAVPALALAMWSEHASLRTAAAEALEKIGPAAQEALPDFCLLLEVGDETLRRIARRTLLRYGPLSTPEG